MTDRRGKQERGGEGGLGSGNGVDSRDLSENRVCEHRLEGCEGVSPAAVYSTSGKGNSQLIGLGSKLVTGDWFSLSEA